MNNYFYILYKVYVLVTVTDSGLILVLVHEDSGHVWADWIGWGVENEEAV
jgi:hypothetical protein